MTEHYHNKTAVLSGSPYEIGLEHGKTLSEEVHANVATYTFFFDETVQITWEQARERAVAEFVPSLRRLYPEILEEMRGIAEGAGGGLTREDILTLNVRSEIALTNYADGCTSISQRTPSGQMFLAQNWDWMEELEHGMAVFDIRPAGSAAGAGVERLLFLGEAGIVGKIGMNSAGFGFCMNAIRSGAKDFDKLPVHVMARRMLQHATSVDSAMAILDEFGVASTINYMMADKSGKHADFECSPHGIVRILPQNGFVAHTNHLCGPNRPARLIDFPAANSLSRLDRINELTDEDVKKQTPINFSSLRSRFSDQQGTPYSICRSRPPGAVGMERMLTLSTILMELTSGTGEVILGKPCDDARVIHWTFVKKS